MTYWHSIDGHPVHLGVFTHDVTCVVYSSPPPPPANIYIQRRLCCGGGMGRDGDRKRERKRKGLLLRQPYKVLFFILHSNSNSNTLVYCTIIGILHYIIEILHKLVRAQGERKGLLQGRPLEIPILHLAQNLKCSDKTYYTVCKLLSKQTWGPTPK